MDIEHWAQDLAFIVDRLEADRAPFCQVFPTGKRVWAEPVTNVDTDTIDTDTNTDTNRNPDPPFARISHRPEFGQPAEPVSRDTQSTILV